MTTVNIKATLLKFEAETLEQVINIWTAMQHDDIKTIKQLIAHDQYFNLQYDRFFNTTVWELTANTQYASNLRRIISYNLIARECEAIADCGKSIAGKYLMLDETFPSKKPEFILLLTELVNNFLTNLKQVAELIATEDKQLAEKLIQFDQVINEQYRHQLLMVADLYLQTKTQKKTMPDQLSYFTTYTLALKSLEKGCDKIVSIAREIIYISTGHIT